ncbi:Serine/threonine-protein kinase ZRK7, partial [Linum perenne]
QTLVVENPPKKINLISCEPLAHISDIKLIRTDTTLDLSQKAEKGMISSIV